MDAIDVAVIQAGPASDPAATLRKVCARIASAGQAGARLVLFPEAMMPAYPRGLTFGTVVGERSGAGRAAFARYRDAAVAVPGPETRALGEAARAAACWVVIGVVERAQLGGTLFCTMLYFGPDGALLGLHRKLKPTGAERLIWGEGDGSTLTTVTTPFARIGGLICWENLMPLARMAMYAKGIDVWLAPTADARDSWQATIRHIACEGRCFVLSANQFVTRGMVPADWEPPPGEEPVLCRGGSAIVDPLGNYLAGPLWDEEGMLTARLDLSRVAAARFDFDVIGHYARPDVFRLTVNEAPATSVMQEYDAAGASGTQATPAR